MTYSKPSKVPRELRQALYGHELMRRLGFTPDEIFVGIQDSHVIVKVQRGRDRYYAFKVAPTNLTVESRSWSRSGLRLSSSGTPPAPAMRRGTTRVRTFALTPYSSQPTS